MAVDRQPARLAPRRSRAREILADLGPLSGGDVVLLHDAIELPEGPEAADRSATVEALPAIIAAARERGLRLQPIEGPR